MEALSSNAHVSQRIFCATKPAAIVSRAHTWQKREKAKLRFSNRECIFNSCVTENDIIGYNRLWSITESKQNHSCPHRDATINFDTPTSYTHKDFLKPQKWRFWEIHKWSWSKTLSITNKCRRYLQLTGQVSSVGVPKASNIFVSWSKSESPAKNGTWNKNKQFLKYMLVV